MKNMKDRNYNELAKVILEQWKRKLKQGKKNWERKRRFIILGLFAFKILA